MKLYATDLQSAALDHSAILVDKQTRRYIVKHELPLRISDIPDTIKQCSN